MIQINGVQFWDKPGSCGTCPFFDNGSTILSPGYVRGYCRMFDEMHNSYINPPRRCQKLFNKAFRYPDGSKLSIVTNNTETDEQQS